MIMKNRFRNHSVAIQTILSFGLLAPFQSTIAQRRVPPPRPAVAPLVGGRYANDVDGDRIDDQLGARVQEAVAVEKSARTAEQKAGARAKLTEPAEVELIFKEPVTQQQIDGFEALGGEITHMYKAISYGWNGRIPLNKISAVPTAMGVTLI